MYDFKLCETLKFQTKAVGDATEVVGGNGKWIRNEGR